MTDTLFIPIFLFAAVWQAVRIVFPTADVRGCVFHFAQAVLRKVGNLGLRPAYENRDGVYVFIRKLLGLPFLPDADIPNAFSALEQDVTHQGLVELLNFGRDV